MVEHENCEMRVSILIGGCTREDNSIGRGGMYAQWSDLPVKNC